MNKQEVVNILLKDKNKTPSHSSGTAFAPANIALAKYWGKRDENINLPYTNSLSLSLGSYGANTHVAQHVGEDYYELNHQAVDSNTEFYTRLQVFLDLFRPTPDFHFSIRTQSNLPIAAGVASSAAGFASLTLALNNFFGWDLDEKQLSIIARLGSGSACRSLWQGFVEWESGVETDGMDSFAHSIPVEWKELKIGLLLFNREKKIISSRKAMQLTVSSSPFYKEWPSIVKKTIVDLHHAIANKDFSELGRVSESNALAMHATMLTAQPSICYWQKETVEYIKKIQKLRKEGLDIYFTQDAGANLKLLFLEKDQENVLNQFPDAILIDPWKDK